MMTLTSRAELTLEAARTRLRPPSRASSAMGLLAAAALAASTALALAAAVILGPPGQVGALAAAASAALGHG